MATEQLAQWTVESIYGPHAKVGRIEVEKRANSTRLLVTLAQGHLAPLFVKWTFPGYQEGHLEPGMRYAPSVAAENQNNYRGKVQDPLRVPKSLLSDDLRGVLVTEYVYGRNLKSLLTRVVTPRSFDIDHVMECAGRALAKYHSLDSGHPREEVGPPPTLNDGAVRSFLDFSAWNLLIAPGGRFIYVVDFPGNRVLARRHRDLATFLHSLLVIKLHPSAIINPRPWWSWQYAYAHFLKAYSEETRHDITEADGQLVQDELRILVQRGIDAYRRRGANMLQRFEASWYSRLLDHPAVRSPSLLSVVHEER